MKRSVLAIPLALLFLCAAPCVVLAEAGLVYYGSTGLKTDGLNGYLGAEHPQDRIVVYSDESPVYLLFYWDSREMQPTVSVSDKAGKKVAEVDLTRGNLVTIGSPGQFVCMLSTRKGSGHWFCVVLSGRQWDP